MNSLSIAKKVWFCLAILGVGYLVSMVAGFFLGLNSEKKVMVTSDALFPAAMGSSAALTAFEKQIKGYNDAILIGEESIFTMTQEKFNEARSNLEAIMAMEGVAGDVKADMAKTVSLLTQFTKTAQSYYGAISREEAEMDDQKMGALAKQTQAIQKQLVEYKTRMAKVVKENLTQISSFSRTQRMMNIWLFVLVVVVSAGSAWAIISRGISRPIGKTVAMLRDIAEGEGDLTKRLEVKSRDEMGEVARWFNGFIDNLQSIIRDFAQNATVLNESSEGLVSLSGHMTKEALNLTTRSNTVSSSARQMSDTLTSVAAAMEETSTNTTMVASAAEQMNATIVNIAQNTDQVKQVSNEAVSQAGSASDKIQELADSVQSIGMVTETITDISEQINLLALNATIEAARAGSAGKGFAVVANEIKELALQTAKSSSDIRNLIGSVQETTGATVSEIEQISTVIDTINNKIDFISTAVAEQSETTRNIADNIAQASQGIQEVNDNVNQTTTAATEISQVIQEVDQSGNAISSSSEQVSISAQDLKAMATKLHTIVSRFKV